MLKSTLQHHIFHLLYFFYPLMSMFTACFLKKRKYFNILKTLITQLECTVIISISKREAEATTCAVYCMVYRAYKQQQLLIPLQYYKEVISSCNFFKKSMKETLEFKLFFLCLNKQINLLIQYLTQQWCT